MQEDDKEDRGVLEKIETYKFTAAILTETIVVSLWKGGVAIL
jgi:hypothetical protein